MTSPIETGLLLLGAKRFSEQNINPTWRGQVQTDRGVVEAYIKLLPARELLVESVAALLGRALGLPIPTPLLVKASRAHLPDAPMVVPDVDLIVFGSEDAKHPSLRQFLLVEQVLEHMRDWPHALASGCFDEWIANEDRHAGNILFDGREGFVLIDHGLSLRKHYSPLDATANNTFLTLKRPDPSDEIGRFRLTKRVNSKVLPIYLQSLQSDWVRLAMGNLYTPAEEGNGIMTFLRQRFALLAQLIGEHLGDPQQDLYGKKYYAATPRVADDPGDD